MKILGIYAVAFGSLLAGTHAGTGWDGYTSAFFASILLVVIGTIIISDN